MRTGSAPPLEAAPCGAARAGTERARASVGASAAQSGRRVSVVERRCVASHVHVLGVVAAAPHPGYAVSGAGAGPARCCHSPAEWLLTTLN